MRALPRVGAIVATGLMSVGAASPGDSTSAAPVSVGDRIRVTVSAPSASDSNIRGTLVALDEKTLIVAPEGKGAEIELSRSQISRVQVFAGRKSNWLAGAAVGAGAGLVFSVVACGDPHLGTCDRMQVATTLGAIGAAGGALIGALVVTERWKTVPDNAVAVSVMPVPVRRGMALAVRVGF